MAIAGLVGLMLASGGSLGPPEFAGAVPSPRSPTATGPSAELAAARATLAIGPARPGELPWTCHGLRALGTSACAGAEGESGTRGVSDVSRTVPPPQAAYDFELAYDSADGYVVLLGAIGTSGAEGATDMWAFDHGSWSSIAPPLVPQNCVGSSLAYDEVDGYLLYFGGPSYAPDSVCTAADQTWAYHHGAWTQLHPSVSPSTRFGAAMTNDSADGYVLLFGGLNDTSTTAPYLDDTWKFAGGQWTELNPTTFPGPREEAGLTYDAADGYAVLFGGVGVAGSLIEGLNDTWEFQGGDWTQLHPEPAPPWPEPDAFSYDRADGGAVFTSAWNFSYGLPEVAWMYRAGAWSPITSPGPVERLGDATAFDYTDGYLLFFGGLGNTNLQDTWSYVGGVWTDLTEIAASLTIANFSIYPSPSRVGGDITLSVSVQGGVPPYTYSYEGLPPGCSSFNTSRYQCIANNSGRYTVAVLVEDLDGDNGSAVVSLTVLPPAGPVVILFAQPSIVQLGDAVAFESEPIGGAPPYTFSWTNLPIGCVTENSSGLSCYPAVLGTYQVTCTLVDWYGETANATATLYVVPQNSSSSTYPSGASSGPTALLGLPPLVFAGVISVTALGALFIGVGVYWVERRPPPGPRR